MSQTIDLIDRNPASVILFNRVVKECNGSDLKVKFNIPDGTSDVDVKLTINGVEVDAVAAMTDTWKRMMLQYDEAVAKAAIDVVSNTRLRKLADVLEKAEWQITDEISKLFPEVNMENLYD